ncbi:sulfotransferase [Pseudoalteromonas sp. NCIMB_1079]|uniref:sulfotransferase n=1 Tax=Pseudoalteromonas sp. NCIMB 1079 TaxID=3142847 RepID=UPI00339D1466
MASDFERFTQSLNESIDLIEQNPQIESGTSSLLHSLDEVLDTPSLLARCDEICQRYEKKKPKLRIIHHLACSGGSLLSKCLAALPNVYLLSEVHPFTDLALGRGKPKYSPTDLIALSHYAGVPNHQDLAGKLFKQAVMSTYQHVEKLGGILVLRDHTHSDYCTSAKLPEKSRVHQLLEEDFEIKSILTIRDPIDSYASLVKNGWVHFSPDSFDEYCRRILVMLDKFQTEQIFKYEDFVDEPQDVMGKICQKLDLPFDDNFEEIFGAFQVTGDSGRSSDEIKKRNKTDMVNMRGEYAQGFNSLFVDLKY